MAFLTDPSISQQVKLPNLAQVYLQAQALKNGQQESQQRTLSLAQATQAMKDEADVRAAYQQGGGDPKATVAALQATNPKKAFEVQTQFAKTAADQAKATADQQKTDLENNLKKVQGLGQLANAATPENWGQIKQAAVTQFGADPNKIPDQFDPNVVKQYQLQSMTAEQKITAALQQKKAEEDARHNTQTEATAAATQQETAKYHNTEAKQRQQQLGIEAGQLGVARQRLGTDNAMTVEQQAQQIANGDVKGLSQSRNNPFARAVMARVYEINPKYSDSLYTMTQALRSDKPNSMGANVGRLGTAVLHADNALKNSNNLGFSEGLLTGVGTEGTAAYKQDAEFLTGEIGQFVTGGKLTVDEGSKLSKDLMSSRQRVRDSAIHEILDLAGGKLKSQMQQYKNATKQDFPTDRVFNDPSIAGALQKHGIIGQPSQGNEMVTVQIPGSPPGQIPQAALDKFRKDHPNAQVTQ